jgi:hypothetical protein
MQAAGMGNPVWLVKVGAGIRAALSFLLGALVGHEGGMKQSGSPLDDDFFLGIVILIEE